MTPRRAQEVAFGLGSNVGDKAAHLGRALKALKATGLVRDLVASAYYRTEPWGPVAQDWYVNGCAVGTSDLDPVDLLRRVKALEIALGRVETVRWGPRIIDIDILYYGDEAIHTPTLTLPHPELLNRCFVLVPLADLRPARRIGGLSIGEAAEACGAAGVRRLAGGD